jgi:hypothetical protein
MSPVDIIFERVLESKLSSDIYHRASKTPETQIGLAAQQQKLGKAIHPI